MPNSRKENMSISEIIFGTRHMGEYTGQLVLRVIRLMSLRGPMRRPVFYTQLLNTIPYLGMKKLWITQ